MHKYTRDIFVKGTMEMFFHDMAMELDQGLKGEAKRAFKILFVLNILKAILLNCLTLC